MIRSILPTDVVTVTSADLDLDEQEAIEALHPLEAELVAAAAPRRRAEFAVTRACARAALARLGGPVAPVGRGGRGMPLWPTGVVGTLTHCDGLRVAAVGSSARLRSLGLDVEPHGPLPGRVLGSVSLPEEADWVEAALAGEPEVRWDRLLFTAKEAVYKTWYPLTRRWLGFEDARLRFTVTSRSDGRTSGDFEALILVDPAVADGGAPLERMHGCWAIDERYVASAVVLRPDLDRAADGDQAADTVER